MPLPPPPAEAFTSSGNPIARIRSRKEAGSSSSTAEGVSGKPASATKRREAILSPIRRITSGEGPIQRSPASSTAAANPAFSARKP